MAVDPKVTARSAAKKAYEDVQKWQLNTFRIGSEDV